MRSRSVRVWVFAVLVIAPAGCAAIEGLSQYEKCTENCDSGADVRVPAADAAGTDAMGADRTVQEDSAPDTATNDGQGSSESESEEAEASSCVSMPVDATTGIFVAPTGTDGTSCGMTPTAPCASIGAGITSAGAAGSGRTLVYVAAGTYTEELKLAPGISVQGGWHYDGTNWSSDCSATPESVVQVQAPTTSNITVLASSIGGAATVSTLTVLSKPAANVQPSESLYGIFATGASTHLTLTDVVVLMQNGGDGQVGTQGTGGPAAPAASTNCSASDGQNVTTPGATGPAASAAGFSSAGFTPQTGGVGVTGTAGDNGTAGVAGQTVVYPQCTGTVPSCTQANMNCVGGSSMNGCGGGGGHGGSGGTGGGSSIALFAFDAAVTLNGGSYTAGNGGRGMAGGSGGPGVAGSAGAAGSPTVCSPSSCVSNACQLGTSVSAAGGVAGGQGGHGATGGQGGSGSGGDSYALITGGVATVSLMVTNAALLAGTGGAIAGGDAGGVASAQGNF